MADEPPKRHGRIQPDADLRSKLRNFRTETQDNFQTLRHELADINKRLDQIEESYANLKGVTKEIDELRAEARAIEKHLGFNKKIAA